MSNKKNEELGNEITKLFEARINKNKKGIKNLKSNLIDYSF